MQDIASSFFGKPIGEITIEDVENYFASEQEENEHIEFKSFVNQQPNPLNHNIKGIIRAICAFLNSDGGMVVWGAPAGQSTPRSNRRRFVGPLSYVSEKKDKDWLINKVSNNISPLPLGIRVQCLFRGDYENVYIFEVQNSEGKPHQYDHTYWARLDGQTNPAPHYLIEALFRRIRYPNIEGYIKFDAVRSNVKQGYYLVFLSAYLFNFSRIQNEEDITFKLLITAGSFRTERGGMEVNYSEKLLHYGTPIRQQVQLEVDENQLSAEGLMTIVLSYAGKRSPAKTSHYTINLSKSNRDPSQSHDTDAITVFREENLLVTDLQDRLGATRESTLQAVLGRLPLS